MPFQRGDIVWVPFTIPHNNKIEDHPALIISNQHVFDLDECYLSVMLTSSEHVDMFTFQITNSMLQKPESTSFSQARCHLIAYMLDSHIASNHPHNKMKQDYVDRLVQHIVTVALEDNEA